MRSSLNNSLEKKSEEEGRSPHSEADMIICWCVGGTGTLEQVSESAELKEVMSS